MGELICRTYLLSPLQCAPVMEFKNLVTLWILCLCLVGESWAEKPSSSTADSQVVENGVSGECRVFCFVSCRFSFFHGIYFVLRSHFRMYPPVELSRCTLLTVSEYITVRVTSWWFFFFLRELYVAMLRIVQLAFSIKPCPLSQIRLTAQTSLYNGWIMECTAVFYTVSLCRRWQAGMCSPDQRHNFSEH